MALPQTIMRAMAGPVPDFVAQGAVLVCLSALPPCFPDQSSGTSTLGTASVAGVPGGQAFVFGDPVTVQAAASGGDGNTAEAGASLIYFFEFAGPTVPAGSLPVDISVGLSATIHGDDALAGATFQLYTDNLFLLGFQRVFCAPDACDSPFGGTLAFGLTPNTVYEVSLNAAAHGIGTAGAQGGTAVADPHIFIDPSFAGAADYTLLLSDGIGNDLPGGGGGGTAPEPSSLLLLSGALFGLRTVRRRLGIIPSSPTAS